MYICRYVCLHGTNVWLELVANHASTKRYIGTYIRILDSEKKSKTILHKRGKISKHYFLRSENVLEDNFCRLYVCRTYNRLPRAFTIELKSVAGSVS
jgi:predicted ATPase